MKGAEPWPHRSSLTVLNKLYAIHIKNHSLNWPEKLSFKTAIGLWGASPSEIGVFPYDERGKTIQI